MIYFLIWKIFFHLLGEYFKSTEETLGTMLNGAQSVFIVKAVTLHSYFENDMA